MSDKEANTAFKQQVIFLGEYVSQILPPLFFFAGPVLGGEDWAVEMFWRLTHFLSRDFTVAIPYLRPGVGHSLFGQATPFQTGTFPRGEEWWAFFSERASRGSEQGGILVWLPKGEVFSEQAMFFLGSWRRKLESDPRFPITIGTDDPIFSCCLEKIFSLPGQESPFVCPSIEATAAKAVERFRSCS